MRIECLILDGKKSYELDGVWISENDLKEKGWVVKSMEFQSSPIAQVPTTGYASARQYSKISIQWLEWMMHTNGLPIQHALNGDRGEFRIDRYSVDGYAEATKTVYSFLGCIHHGCRDCFKQEETEKPVLHPYTRQTMTELYQNTILRERYIRQRGYRYIFIWECAFKRMVKQNENGIKDFVEGLDIPERLNPRDSFFGGRTNASKLYYKAGEGEKIHYVDFTSLYPYVNKYMKYPVGHPQIILKNFKDLRQYFGIAKVKMLPPRGLYHLVLPYRSNDKLKFPLCASCADREQVTPCVCTDED